MKVEIICPLYNAEMYIKKLHKSFLMQEYDDTVLIKYILTTSKDDTENILIKLNANYETINPSEFSHSLTREKAAMKSDSDVIVFVTQDVVIKSKLWLKNLVADIGKDNIVAAYSRQICVNNSIERYTRLKNYPEHSSIVSEKDIAIKGLRTFFFSDAAGAIKTDIFKKLNGYDGKKLPISEDMYFAYKIIMNGYNIKYCANSEVEHSHNFSFNELYKRYFDTGRFFKQNPYLDKFGTTDSGLNMAIYILKMSIKEKNFRALKEFIPNMLARYLGMKRGKKHG